MALILPVGSAVMQAASFTLDKVIMSMKKVTYKTYVGISFPLIFLITLIIFFIFRPPLTWSLFAGWALYLMIALIILTILTNLIFYRTLKTERISEVEALSLLSQITLIVYSSIFFPDERNIFIIFLALLCSVSIVWSHWRKGHFQVAKKTKLYLFWTILVTPIGMIISNILLTTWDWNPISLQLVRDGVMALIIGPMFLRFEKKASLKAFMLLIATNVLTAIAWILYYTSVKDAGIVPTVLVFSLQPLLVYFASIFVLKEKLHWKKLVSFIIVLAAIVVYQVFAPK